MQCGRRLPLKRRQNVKFDVIIVNRGAGTQFKPITNLITEGIKGIGGAEALGATSHAFALRHEAIATSFHCYVEFHAAPNLRPVINLVNYRHNNGAQRGLAIFHDLPGGVAFINDQHALADTHTHAAINGDEIAAGLPGKILFLDDHHLLPVVERVVDRRNDGTPDSADDHDS